MVLSVLGNPYYSAVLRLLDTKGGAHGNWAISGAMGPMGLSSFDEVKGLMEMIRFLCSKGDGRSDNEVPGEQM